MGRSPSITVGDAGEGVRVEHVKTKGLVRLVRWQAGRAEDDVVGLEVSDFCARLGITTDVLDPAGRRYLLVADPRRAGAGHVVAIFDTEERARAEFVRFRRSEPGGGAWAELSEITARHPMRRICWFGSPGSSPYAPSAGSRRVRARRVSWRRQVAGAPM